MPSDLILGSIPKLVTNTLYFVFIFLSFSPINMVGEFLLKWTIKKLDMTLQEKLERCKYIRKKAIEAFEFGYKSIKFRAGASNYDFGGVYFAQKIIELYNGNTIVVNLNGHSDENGLNQTIVDMNEWPEPFIINDFKILNDYVLIEA